MSDPFHEALLRNQQGGQKPFRRKRIQKGEEFRVQDPPTMQEVHRGLWCRTCKVRHPYNGTINKRLGLNYERRGESRVLLWSCPVNGNVVGETVLGETRLEEDMAHQTIVVQRTLTYTVKVDRKCYPNMTDDQIRMHEQSQTVDDALEELASVEAPKLETEVTFE